MLRTALLATAAAAGLMAAPAVAQAQPAGQGVDVGEIVVTGSRIRRPELTSVQPLQVITTQSMEERGFTNVAEALNDLPSVGVPVSPVGDQGSFGVGRNFINIFNLGTNRTLTLVNGHRFVGGNPASIFTGANGGGQVDLNVIPTGLIDRIETIQAGGSAVYGSDAIAGVVNIITRSDFDGVEVDGRYGWGAGNYDDWRLRVTAGRKFLSDKLSLSGSWEYNETSALANADRPVVAQALTFANNPANRGTNDLIAGQIIWPDRRVPELTLGGLPMRGAGIALSTILTIPDPANPANRIPAQFGPGGTLIPYDTGTFVQATVGSGGDGLNLTELGSLISPTKRHVATGFAQYDFTDNIRLNAELFYSTLEAVEPFNQPIFNSGVFGGFGAASGPLRFSTANPFLPAATRAALLDPANALPVDPANPGERLFFLHRASLDIGPNRTSTESQTWRGVLTLSGDLNLLDRDFFWDLSAIQGRNWGWFQSPNIVQSRFVQAVNINRDASGNAQCADATARANGCVPLNLFGTGGVTDAALAYVGVQFRSDFAILQTVYEGNFGGDILQLPGGAWSFAAGFEARYEKSDFNPNDPQEAGVGRSAAISAIAGKFNTKELYVETLVPVFGGDFTYPLLNRLELEGAYRKVDHSQAGEGKAWSYGVRWYPIADLLLRAQKSQSFRAPAITELFLPTASIFTTATDPCHSANINSGPSPATRRANCEAEFQRLGLPASFNLISQVQQATVQGTTSGSPDLANEIADQWTVGFVYQPSFVPGLALNFDWVNIQLTDAIANFTLTSILQVCYDSPTPQPDACSRFQRGTSTLAAGRQAQILTNGEAVGDGTTATGPRTGFINAGYTNFEGFTAGIDYRANLDEFLDGVFRNLWGGNPGELQFNFDLFHVKRQQTSVTGLGFDLNRDHGEIGNAKWRWRAQASYNREPLNVTWTTNWIDESRFNNDFTVETRYPLTIDDYFLHDLSITWDFGPMFETWGMAAIDNVEARFIVRNVFDTDPPYAAGTSANSFGTYDFIGRYYQVGLTARF